MLTHGSKLKEAKSLEDMKDAEVAVVVHLLKLSTSPPAIIQVSRLETATAEIIRNMTLKKGSKSAEYSVD